jgi:hypothetical protein
VLFSKKILYPHLPKTGGSTIKNCLQRTIPDEYWRIADYDSRFPNAFILDKETATRTESKDDSIEDVVFLNGDKHLPIDQAMFFIDAYCSNLGVSSKTIETIFVSIRNPYDLIVSMWTFNLKWKNIPENTSLGDFVRTIPYFSNYGTRGYIESLNPNTQKKIRIIKFEDLQNQLTNELNLLGYTFNETIPKLNSTEHLHFAEYYKNNAELEEMVYALFKSFFDNNFYKRYEGL